MNHPLGAVEHCVVQDYTVTVPSNQGNGEKGRQIAGLCTRSIDLYTYPQGWRGAGTFYSHANIPKGSFAPRGGRQSLWFPHLMSTYPVIGVIEKVTWHWRWWDLLGNIKGHVLCQKTFMMCKLNIVQCIYKRFSDMRLIDVWRTECLSTSIWTFHQIANRWRQFEWSKNSFN